jgi:hypothetical protein
MNLNAFRKVLPAVLVIVGCAEVAPTSPVMEQRVLAALGGLDVGQSLTLSGAAAHHLVFGGTADAGEYVVVPFHASRTGGASVALRIEGTGITQPPTMSVESGHHAWTDADRTADWDLHEALRARMKEQVERHVHQLRRSDALHLLDLPPARTDLGGDNAFVGQLVPLNADAFGPACQATDTRTGRVEAISDRAIIVADIDNPAGGFTSDDYRFFADEFDRLIHPTVTAHFGQPTDIDGNRRAIVFFTRAVNELTEPGSGGVVAGFFWVRDLIPQAAGCPASNEAEIFFMLVPDPNAQASHLPHSRENVLQSTVATLAHEYQHLINGGRRIVACGFDCFETIWLDEGLSHIAEELLFYEETGRTTGENISRGNTPTSEFVLLNRYMGQNLIRYGLYLEEVTNESAIHGASLEARGAIWAFLRYAADHSGRSDPDFFGSLVNTTLTGIDNLNQVLAGTTFDWLRRWGVAVYADDLVATSEPFYTQPSWDYRSWLDPVFVGGFPLDPHGLIPGGSVEFDVRAGTSGYVRVRGSAGEVSRVTTTSGGGAPPGEVRITILRTR